jgi:hypothetical protein
MTDAPLWAIAFALILQAAEHADVTVGLHGAWRRFYVTLLVVTGGACVLALVRP